MSFIEKLRSSTRRNGSLLCVGLDVDQRLLPVSANGNLLRFNQAIVEQTHDLVCAYKLNLAFYLAGGAAGIEVLQQTIRLVPEQIPVILDLKCGDIQNTAEQYASACFEQFGCDAVTVNPLMGSDAVTPFLKYSDCCTFVLCLTSNPSAADFERQALADGLPLFRHVARRIAEWSQQGQCGAVVAPVDATSMQDLRAELPDTPFLIPGIGAQGLDLEVAVRYGADVNHELAIINISRGIIYASQGADFPLAARQAAQRYKEEINRYR